MRKIEKVKSKKLKVKREAAAYGPLCNYKKTALTIRLNVYSFKPPFIRLNISYFHIQNIRITTEAFFVNSFEVFEARAAAITLDVFAELFFKTSTG
ncbi:MAG: hypothetical protein GY757_22195 [bacterium]|nr:hypothetical protein [bacterium]